MGDKIIMGYWDCPSCNSKKIAGIEKNCPHCGAPKGKVKYYLDSNHEEVLDKKTSADYGKGANWICPYCGNQNRYYSTECEGCGSSKTNSTEDYFDNNPNETASTEEMQFYKLLIDRVVHKDNETNNNDDLSNDSFSNLEPSHTNKSFKSTILNFFSSYSKELFSVLAFLAIIAVLIVLLLPKKYDAVVTSNSWERTISIEEYKTVKEDGWSVPSGGRVYKTANEIHHYDSVVDHYETVTIQKSREVLDHYDTTTYDTYSDNGDGTYTKHSNEVKTPVYITEYYTEEEDQPVYVDVPRYQTKYYYEIDKWIYNRTEKSSGTEKEKPYWPKYILAKNERTGEKTEKYLVVFLTDKKEYTKEVTEAEWETLPSDTSVQITVQAGIVTKYEIKE